jgi:hypothetical protein
MELPLFRCAWKPAGGLIALVVGPREVGPLEVGMRVIDV